MAVVGGRGMTERKGRQDAKDVSLRIIPLYTECSFSLLVVGF